MDSMRSLDTSLPRTRRRQHQASSEVLQAFKAAALSVTQLYKNASADVDSARTTGYQDALDDLLAFLDQENIGLGDGEGWRVRQWATERLSPSSFGFSSDNEDEEREERGRTSSPSRASAAETAPRERQNQSAPPTEVAQAQPRVLTADTASHQPEVFTFRAGGPTIADVDMNSADAVSQAVRLDLLPRSSRAGLARHSSHTGRSQLPSISIGNIGAGAGSKRKQNFGDFFDIGSIGGKDIGGYGGSSSSKRNRHG